MSLTVKQKLVLDCLQDLITINGYPPSLSQIGKKLGMRPRNVQVIMQYLVDKGYVGHVHGKWQDYQILKTI